MRAVSWKDILLSPPLLLRYGHVWGHINAVGDHCSIPICLNIAKMVMCTVVVTIKWHYVYMHVCVDGRMESYGFMYMYIMCVCVRVVHAGSSFNSCKPTIAFAIVVFHKLIWDVYITTTLTGSCPMGGI